MHDDAKFQAAYDAALYGDGPRAGELWRHRRSGKVARVLYRCLIESGPTPAVLYFEPPDSLVPWVRPLAEFIERFEREG